MSTSLKSGQIWEEYLVIWNSYVAREHPDAEYKYHGVFVAIIDNQAGRRDLHNIYTLHTFIAYLYSLLSCPPRRILHTPKLTGLVYSFVFRILLPPITVVYGFWYMLFSFLDRLEASLFCELFVHCRLGDFLMPCTSAEVFGSMFSGFGFLL